MMVPLTNRSGLRHKQARRIYSRKYFCFHFFQVVSNKEKEVQTRTRGVQKKIPIIRCDVGRANYDRHVNDFFERWPILLFPPIDTRVKQIYARPIERKPCSYIHNGQPSPAPPMESHKWKIQKRNEWNLKFIAILHFFYTIIQCFHASVGVCAWMLATWRMARNLIKRHHV